MFRKQPDNLLEGLIFFLLLIPFAAFFVLKKIFLLTAYLIASCISLTKQGGDSQKKSMVSTPTSGDDQKIVSPQHTSATLPTGMPNLKVNQLTADTYIIGQSIPEGTYDLVCVWGSGSLTKYVDSRTTLGASNYFQWIGLERSYENQCCVGVVCKNGEYLHIDGNVIVEIRKAKAVEINL